MRDHWSDLAGAVVERFPEGAALLEAGVSRGWVLCEDGDVSGLGPALVWAQKANVEELHVLVDPAAGHDAAPAVMARRAGMFRAGPRVWSVAGRDLIRAAPAPSDAPGAAAGLPPEASHWAEVMVAYGIDPVVEHGVLSGEVLGLEVARLVHDEVGWRLAIGVGDHDRFARAEMRPGEDVGEALRQVGRLVRERRSPAARHHPANNLATERWLRAIVMASPHLAGAARLVPLAPPIARGGLCRRSPAPAAGSDDAGQAVVVVCSTGIDPDLVPSAADSRLLDGRGARLVLVIPEGDDHPATRRLAAALVQPAEIVTIERDWPALTWSPEREG